MIKFTKDKIKIFYEIFYNKLEEIFFIFLKDGEKIVINKNGNIKRLIDRRKEK